MIHEISITTAWQHGDVLADMHRLRNRLFADPNGWDVPRWRGMEYDQFDSLPARYLVARGPGGEVQAMQRNLFCGRPYMLKTLWPELADGRELPATDDWAEGTRSGVARDLPPAVYRRRVAELLLANIEWALLYGVRHYTFVTYEKIVPSMRLSGLPVELWGKPRAFPDGNVVAGYWEVSEALLRRVRASTQISAPVLVPMDADAPVELLAAAG